MISLDSNVTRDLHESTRREWLVTNGIGGFACGTVSGVATRRYHGLLVAALHPPRGRHVLITHLNKILTFHYTHTSLTTHTFPNTINPNKHQHIKSFTLNPLPT